MTALTSLPMPAGRTNNFWYVSNSSDTVVVFVHGVFSSSRSCWLCEDASSEHKTFWPDLVRTDIRLGHPSIYLAGYHTNLESGDYSLTECATELRDALRLKDADQTRAPYDYDRLVFVCHSTGGIVVRYLINRYKADFKDKDVGLALMASPSLGSEWADVFALAAKYYNQDLGRQLSWDDSALQDLHWQFSELVENRFKEMPGLFGREAAEHHMIGRIRIPKLLRWLFPPRNTVVNKVSAGQYFGQVRQIPGTDHFSIVKPNGLDHPSHAFLVGFMMDFSSDNRASAAMIPPESLTARHEVVQRPGGAPTNSPGVRPLDLESTDWPETVSETVHFFVADSGFDPKSETVVVACVVVDDAMTLEQRWCTAIGSMLEDPHLSAVDGALEGIRRQQFGYRDAAPGVRVKISELLQSLTFEAFVGFTRQNARAEETYGPLVRAVVFDRLRAYRTRDVAVNLQTTSESGRAVVSSVVDAVSAELRQIHRDSLQVPRRIVALPSEGPGPIVAEYVAEIVRERLNTGRGARMFDLVHPRKLRVIYDLDSGIFYTRRRPFPG